MAVGLVFHLSANAYLLAGIPITIGFQRYVRRAPLLAMWVRSAPPLRLGAGGTVVAILLTIRPLIDLVNSIRSHESPATSAWFLVAMAGAWPAAYALRNFRRETFRELLICLATAGVVGCAIMAGLAFLNGFITGFNAWSKVTTGLASFLQYLPVVFLLEEVWFPGVLDSHLHRPGEALGVFSAVYVSALWGIWHFAESHNAQDLLPTLVSLLVVHIAIGTLLSRAWRRSGNLLAPGSVHALIDAVRNAIL